MADENMDNPTVEDDGNVSNGDNTSGDSGDETSTVVDVQTVEKIEKYKKETLAELIKLAESKKKVGCLDFKGKLEAKKYKHCMLLQSNKNFQEYFGIKNYVSTTVLFQSAQVDINVDGYIEKTKLLGEALDGSLNAIKESKDKIWKIREAACKLDSAINDSCNSEQLKALNKIFKDAPEDPSGLTPLQLHVKGLVEQANKLSEMANEAFESGIIMAGNQASINTESFKELSTSLSAKAKSFEEDVNGNITYSSEKMNKIQEEYSELISETNKSLFAKDNAIIHLESLNVANKLIETIKNDECITDPAPEPE